ncbi:hypothetical protein BDM02DRAFT_1799425 [Thelephora ganbajun]|uniref:Uncharacterized protein n=1 Tax=Thelephora ganbajun TaxID=370292 RepID=A0ACB6YZQ6_THEGA|nr:hypothetical protein BDM02DRAFT_1799425 [Thelephora ganbajun]
MEKPHENLSIQQGCFVDGVPGLLPAIGRVLTGSLVKNYPYPMIELVCFIEVVLLGASVLGAIELPFRAGPSMQLAGIKVYCRFQAQRHERLARRTRVVVGVYSVDSNLQVGFSVDHLGTRLVTLRLSKNWVFRARKTHTSRVFTRTRVNNRSHTEG